MSSSDLYRGLSLLKSLNQCGRTILSVNENEFRVLYRQLVDSETILPDPGKSVSLCRKKLPAGSIILRTLHRFYYSSEEEEITVDNSIENHLFALLAREMRKMRVFAWVYWAGSR